MVFLVNDNTDNVATKSTSLVAQENKGSMNISQPLEGVDSSGILSKLSSIKKKSERKWCF